MLLRLGGDQLLQICRTVENPHGLPNNCHRAILNSLVRSGHVEKRDAEGESGRLARLSPGDAEGTMQRKLRVGRSPAWLTGLISLAILTVAGIFPAAAQDAAAGGGGQYYIEFRARYAWDYGHTFLVHGRVGEPLTKASVA